MAYKKFEPFTYKTLSDLEQKIKDLNLDIPISSEVEILQQRIRLGSRFIANRLAIQPMEGADSLENGAPSDLTHRRYERFAKGGAGLIWFEATAINNVAVDEDDYVAYRVNLSFYDGEWVVERIRVMS